MTMMDVPSAADWDGVHRSQPVSTATMLRYGVGFGGAQVFRDTPAALLPLFMTTILGVAPWLAGLAILLPKLWVIVCDPAVGAWSDRLNARRGRAPFLITGALLTSAGFAALFAFSDWPSPWAAATGVCLIYLLASTGFSAFSVPYMALASELSHDSHERTKILTFRMAFAIVGVVVGIGVAQPLVFYFGGGPRGWQIMGVAIGAFCLAAMLTTAIGLRGICGAPRTGAKVPLRAQVRTAFANRLFRLLSLTYMIQSIAQACGYSVLGFFFIYTVGDVALILPFILMMALGSAIAQPFLLWASQRHGKGRIFALSTAVWCLVTLSFVFVTPDADVLLTLPLIGPLSTQQVLVLLRAAPLAIANNGFVLLILSMLTDVIALERRAVGQADEGVFAGLFTATEKLSFAIGPWIGGMMLSGFGFVASTTGVIAQSRLAVLGVTLIYSLIPAVLMAAGLLVFRAFQRQARASAIRLGMTDLTF